VPLRPELQALFDTIMAAHPDGLTLDDLSDELVNKPVSYAEVEELIDAFEAAGIDLTGPDVPARPDELMRVLTAARTLTDASGKRPSMAEIAAHAGLSPAAVHRALRLGRSLGG
jgi:AraC-like DNA-binding protein